MSSFVVVCRFVLYVRLVGYMPLGIYNKKAFRPFFDVNFNFILKLMGPMRSIGWMDGWDR